MLWKEKLVLDDQFVAICPRFERKSKSVPYTLAKGHHGRAGGLACVRSPLLTGQRRRDLSGHLVHGVEWLSAAPLQPVPHGREAFQPPGCAPFGPPANHLRCGRPVYVRGHTHTDHVPTLCWTVRTAVEAHHFHQRASSSASSSAWNRGKTPSQWASRQTAALFFSGFYILRIFLG